MPESTVPWTLVHYIDIALGSSFTVGIADEGPCNPAVSTMPESSHVIAVTPEPSKLPRQSLDTSWPPGQSHITSWPPHQSPFTSWPFKFPHGSFFRGCYMSQAPADLGLGPALNLPAISMVVSSLVVSSQAVSSPSPVVLEVIPPSRVLPVVANTIVCVWAT